jgi:hypothetical protein
MPLGSANTFDIESASEVFMSEAGPEFVPNVALTTAWPLEQVNGPAIRLFCSLII